MRNYIFETRQEAQDFIYETFGKNVDAKVIDIDESLYDWGPDERMLEGNMIEAAFAVYPEDESDSVLVAWLLRD